jgi:signal transduction histidine kinase
MDAKSSSYNELLNYVAELENKVRVLERKLEENKDKAERLKTKFLGNVSHELRTPMNAILGFSNLLIDKNIPHEKREEYMEHINQSSTNLLRIVDARIEVSLLEINELRINKENCHLGSIVQQVYYFFNIDRHKTGKEHIVLLLNRDKRLSESNVFTDPYRLTQILSLLLNNAFKFTTKGIVEIGFFPHSDTHIQFYVKDSGRGISIDRAHAIFEKFEKLDEDYGNAEGVGLGLSLAKGIVDLLGGEIWAEKNIVRGSTFNFTIQCSEMEIKQKSVKASLSGILL